MGAACGKKEKEPIVPEDPTPDPITGLTQRQKVLLKKSWYTIQHKRNIKDTGTKLLIKLFTKNPDLLICYEDLRNCQISDLPDNVNFRAYAVSVIMRISAFVESTDDPDILMALINKHSFTQNVSCYTLQDMKILKEVFLEFLIEETGLDENSDVFKAWNTLLAFHNRCLVEKIEKAQAEKALRDCPKQGSIHFYQTHGHTGPDREIRDTTDPVNQNRKVLASAMGGFCTKKRNVANEVIIVDEFTGLTETEKDLILKSWHKITEKESLVKVGLTIFLKAFAIYPYLQDFFIFLNEKGNNVTSNMKFRAHVLRFMYAVTAFVENLDDIDTLRDLMTKISEQHARQNITYDDMQRIIEVFLEFMQDMLGKDSKSSSIVAWDKLFSTFMQTYAAVLKRAANQQRLKQQQPVVLKSKLR